MTQSGGQVVRRPTIKDVASLAGVSHQTVSRFFSRPDGLKPATLAKVTAAVDELGYRPSAIARSMRTRTTKKILVVLPSLTSFLPVEMLKGASDEAQSHGYSVEILLLEGGEHRPSERVLDLAVGGQVDGVLLLASVGDVDHASLDIAAPIVTFREYDAQMHGVGPMADGRIAADIVDYLVRQGHRNLIHIAGPQDWPSARNRKEAFLQRAAEAGLDAPLVVESDWTIAGGFAASDTLDFPNVGTAVFAANDRIAFGVVRNLQRRGFAVPEDVSIIGWDDDPMSAFMDPALTTVRVNPEAEGRAAARTLLMQIGENIEEQPDLVARHAFIIRDSVKRRNREIL